MATTKEELVASSIRRQIAFLEGLLAELESYPERTPDVKDRMRQVEGKLHLLRVTLSDETHL